ncbi:MAG: tRNA (adenosine(37)-N6)-threonylcarbamoyltransferase complex transferase subunit TsaD, partial [Gemmatimonadetes bacterium]|nr:tRNA (adenosine(37)-N6)-threonylcarbamoyltransferase complex transferase subunit TsaD [Gemmatimonadota bacterium]
HTLLLYAPAWGSYRLLGSTRDDAVGEAFDKVARRLGLGFPGGPEIEKLARQGVAGTYRLPRPMLATRDGPGDAGYFDFSFSGLKTAASLLIADIEQDAGADADAAGAHVAAEFQEAVLDVLVAKTLRAVEHTGCGRVLLGGGVARNGPLRDRLASALEPAGQLFAPSPRLSTDNAAMVARLAEHRLTEGQVHGLDLNADPALPFPGLS